MKRRTFWLAMLLCVGPAFGQTGTVRTFRGNGFLMGIGEPQGWVITMDAPQLAHFVLNREGTTWREADSIIFVRLIERRDDETAEQFVNRNIENFEKACPAPEVRDVDLELKGERKFWIKSYDCAAMRHELTAVTEVKDFIVLFVLSSRTIPPNGPDVTAYQEVLSSFFWQDLPKKPTLDSPKNPSQHEPPHDPAK